MPSYEQAGYSLGNGLVDPSDSNNKHLKQMKDHFYNTNYTQASTSWVQGAIDKRFKVGDQQMGAAVYGQNNYQNYQKFFFNLVRRHINMICGRQRQNRKSTITLPNSDGDDPIADDYNKVMRWCEDRDGFQEYLSQAFELSCDTGMSWLHLYTDYTFDPISGDQFTDAVSFQNILHDQYFRKQDLSDCNGIWRRRWTSKEGTKLMLPGYASEIDKMRPGGSRDGRFPLQAELQNASINGLFVFDEFYYRTTRTGKVILDPKTGESAEWDEDEHEEPDMLDRILYQQPWLQVTKTQIPTVKLSIALGDKEVYNGPNLLGIDQYPFIPSICYHEPDIQGPAWRTMGVIRNLRDAQFLYNMRKVIELQMLQSSLNAGWIYPVDVVTDAKALRQTSGGDGFLIPLKSGHLPNEIQRIEPVNIPQSLLELSASLSEDITRISGVNEELLGAATDDKSGILSMLRQGAGLTTLQTIFDKLDYTQRLYGKIRLQAIRKNFSRGKIKNILGHEPDPRFFSSHSQKYGITVEEGNYSATQRQMELQQLLHFKELGVQVADKSILRAAFITNKKLVMQEMEEQSQQAMQQQQAEAARADKESNAKVMDLFAKSKLNMAKEKEAYASTQEKYANMTLSEAKAAHEDMLADLEALEKIITLEDMDHANFKNTWQLSQQMKKAEKAEREEKELQKQALGAGV